MGNYILIGVAILLGLILVVEITALVCYLMTFYSKKRKPLGDGEY